MPDTIARILIEDVTGNFIIPKPLGKPIRCTVCLGTGVDAGGKKCNTCQGAGVSNRKRVAEATADKIVDYILSTGRATPITADDFKERYVSGDAFEQMDIPVWSVQFGLTAKDEAAIERYVKDKPAGRPIVIDRNDKVQTRAVYKGGQSYGAVTPHYILDGKHRLEAARRRGDFWIDAWVERSLLSQFEKDADYQRETEALIQKFYDTPKSPGSILSAIKYRTGLTPEDVLDIRAEWRRRNLRESAFPARQLVLEAKGKLPPKTIKAKCDTCGKATSWDREAAKFNGTDQWVRTCRGCGKKQTLKKMDNWGESIARKLVNSVTESVTEMARLRDEDFEKWEDLPETEKKKIVKKVRKLRRLGKREKSMEVSLYRLEDERFDDIEFVHPTDSGYQRWLDDTAEAIGTGTFIPDEWARNIEKAVYAELLNRWVREKGRREKAERKEAREALRKWLDDFNVKLIQEYFDSYDRNLKHFDDAPAHVTRPSPPVITASFIKGDLLYNRGGFPDELPFIPDREVLSEINNSLKRLKRAGKLDTTLAPGPKGGEVRAYEPKGWYKG
jgi:hypothetical protein